MDKLIIKLEQVLKQQTDVHEQLLDLLRRKREAMRQGKHELVADCCRLENEKLRLISQLETDRLMLVGQFTQQFMPNAAEPMTLPQIADRLDEPHRGRLLVLREKLRQRMQEVRDESRVAKAAMDALVKHMNGLIQSVTGVWGGVTTYTAQGTVPNKALSVSTFSMTA